MKHNKMKRVLAILLCMSMMFGSSVSALAENEGHSADEEASESVQTEVEKEEAVAELSETSMDADIVRTKEPSADTEVSVEVEETETDISDDSTSPAKNPEDTDSKADSEDMENPDNPVTPEELSPDQVITPGDPVPDQTIIPEAPNTDQAVTPEVPSSNQVTVPVVSNPDNTTMPTEATEDPLLENIQNPSDNVLADGQLISEDQNTVSGPSEPEQEESDPTADIESTEDWDVLLENIEHTEVISENVLEIAKSQIGYTESVKNFIMTEDGEKKGYNRYAAWYKTFEEDASEYDDWTSSFVMFCLYYADVHNMPFDTNCEKWIEMLSEEECGLYHAADADYEPTPGNIVFYTPLGEDKIRAGLLKGWNEDGTFMLIAGDVETEDGDQVCELTCTTGNSEDEELQTVELVGYSQLAGESEAISPISDDLEIQVNLPKDIYKGQVYDLLQDAKVINKADQAVQEGFTISVETVKRMIDNDQKEEVNSQEWSAETSTFKPLSVGGYEISWMAVKDNLTVSLSKQIQVRDKGQIGEELQSDEAHVTSVNVRNCVTGTKDFDGDDNPGNDSGPDNNIVRTYDLIQYTVEYQTEMYDKSQPGYKKARVYFEFVLPLPKEQAQFCTGNAMSWLEAKEASYEIQEKMMPNGEGEIACQVLRGSFLAEASGDNPNVLGSGFQTLTINIRVLNMKNGNLVKPLFTFWLEGNDVGLQETDYHDHIPNLNAPLITGRTDTCKEAGHDVEQKTCEADEVKVSAAPRYNIKVVNGGEEQTQYLGKFDFNTGVDTAPNRNSGEIEGRLGAYGLNLQILGKSGQGMKGVELPDEGAEVTFDLKLSSTYSSGDNTYDNNQIPAPLFWSIDEAKEGGQKDGRPLACTSSCPNRDIPYNRNKEPFHSCYNGGDWSYEYDEANKVIHVTVSNFEIDLTKLPSHNGGTSRAERSTYYNPDVIGDNYWDIENACFSTGEAWAVQPYYDDNEYIAEKYDSGSFLVKLEASNLKITKSDGSNIAEELTDKMNDNSESQGMALEKPGSIDNYVIYLKNPYGGYQDALVNGCVNNGKDWATVGQDITIQDYIFNDNAEGDRVCVAYDQMIKFDDTFFEPEVVEVSSAGYSNSSKNGAGIRRVFFGVIGDGDTGWNHQGKGVDDPEYDEDMIQSTGNELTYYAADCTVPGWQYKVPENLKDKRIVAVLTEWRGVADVGGMNHLHTFVKGKVRQDVSLVDHVYMVTHNAYAWCKADVKGLVAEYKGKDALTDQDYTDYVLNVFPSKGGTKVPQYPDAYRNSFENTTTQTNRLEPVRFKEDKKGDYGAVPFWIATGATEPGNSGIGGYQKNKYTSDGKWNGGTSGQFWGDSCRVIGYVSEIAINTADPRRKTYDLDTGRRYVDYRIDPAIVYRGVASGTEGGNSGKETETTVTIMAALPEGLTYQSNACRVSRDKTGTYKAAVKWDKAGYVEGETLAPKIYTPGGEGYEDALKRLKEKEVTLDGKKIGTILEWTTEETISYAAGTIQLDPIYFSCLIGTPDNSVTDVKNGDGFEVFTTISSSGDNNRSWNTDNNNLRSVGIVVSKNLGGSLSKTADQSVIDVNDQMSFTMNIGNNSGESITDRVIVEKLPYKDDLFGSKFNGSLEVTDFSVENYGTLQDKLQFYYTTDKGYQNEKASENVYDSSYFKKVGLDFDDDKNWKTLKLNEEGKIVKPEGIFQPTLIIAKGELPAYTTLKMHIKMKLTGAKSGDVVVNRLSSDEFGGQASVSVVNRSLEGLVWYDRNKDGVQDADEARMKNVQITLLKLNTETNKYETYQIGDGTSKTSAVVQSGKQMDVKTGDTYVYTSSIPEEITNDLRNGTAAGDAIGRYRFYNLPEGTFAVQFGQEADSKFQIGAAGKSYPIEAFKASPVDQGTDDTKDSDGVADGTNAGALTSTKIEGIDMPTAAWIGDYWTEGWRYESKNHDSGFYMADLTIAKKVVGSKAPDSNKKFTFELNASYQDQQNLLNGLQAVKTASDGTTSEITLTAKENVVQVSLGNGEQLKIMDLPYGAVWSVKEQTSDGYTVNYLVDKQVGGDLDQVNASYGTTASEQKLMDDKNVVTFYNVITYSLPSAGGTGAEPYAVAGTVLMMATCWLYYRKRQKAGRG